MSAGSASCIQIRRNDTEFGSWEQANRLPHLDLRFDVLRLFGRREESWKFSHNRRLPTASISVVIDFGRPTTFLDDSEAVSLEVSEPYVIGITDQSTLSRRGAGWEGVIVEMTPIGARRFLGVPLGEFVNRVVPLSDLIGPSVSQLQNQLADAKSWEVRFSLLEKFVSARTCRENGRHTELDVGWNLLGRRRGSVSIDVLRTTLGVSHKRLAAEFRQEFGLTPKPLSRLLRLDRAFHLLSQPADMPWTSIAASCGYYDQAHMINEIRRHVGLSPTYLRGAVRAGWGEPSLTLGKFAQASWS